MRVLAASVLVLLAWAAPVVAEDAPSAPAEREVTFPRHGIGLRAPSAWEIRQYGADLAAWSGPGVEVTLRIADEPSPPADATEVADGFRVRRKKGRTGTDRGFEIVARTKPDDLAAQTAVDAALDSVDVRPLPNPRVHADWKRGWTIEVPDGWDLVREAPKARFAPKSGGCLLSVDAWADVGPEAKGEAPADLAGWTALAIRLAKEERIAGAPIVASEEPEVAEIGVGAGVDARLAGFKVQTEAMKAKGESGWVQILVTTTFRLMLVCDAASSEASKASLEIFRSFEPDTLAASRVAAPPAGEKPTDRFPGETGPAVVFRLPSGWKASPPTSQMRLAQYEIPGEPPAEVVVYFFGPGGGGGVQANLDRWKEQMHGTGEPKTAVLDPAEGIRLHVLDALGTYVATGMGAGAPVHISDARMIAAVVECAGGPIFVKTVGTQKTVDAAAPAILDWLKSFRPAR